MKPIYDYRVIRAGKVCAAVIVLVTIVLILLRCGWWVLPLAAASLLAVRAVIRWRLRLDAREAELERQLADNENRIVFLKMERAALEGRAWYRADKHAAPDQLERTTERHPVHR